MKKSLLFIYVSMVWMGYAFAQQTVDHILKEFNEVASESVLAVSHHANWRNAPEDSLQTTQNCVDMGIDMVEIGLKRTKDGHLILVHDKAIGRAITGKDKPGNCILEELQQFQLKNGTGHKTRHQIPTFEEIMILCKGRIMVNMDKGYDYFKETYAILEKTGTAGQCVMKAGSPCEQVKFENGDILNRMIFMPVMNLQKADAEAVIDSYLTYMSPKAFELVFNNGDPEVLCLIDEVRPNGVRIFINDLWPELCEGRDDDRAVELHEPDESWGRIIGRRAKLVQTDRPALLLDYLRAKKLHN